MSIDFAKLKQLREETGISFSACKKALEEANNDIKKAKEKLKSWGMSKAREKADRATGDGGIFSYIHHNKKIAALVELASETDFVSGNSEFQTLGQELAMQAASVRAEGEKEFLKSEYVRDPGRSIADLVQEAVVKFGENIKVVRILRWELGEK